MIVASVLFDLLQSACVAIAVLAMPDDSDTSAQNEVLTKTGSSLDAVTARPERHPDSDPIQTCRKHLTAGPAQMVQSSGGGKDRMSPEAWKSTPLAALTALRPQICSG